MVLVEAEEGAQDELGGERGWFGSWSSTRGGQHQGQAQQRQQRLKGIRNQSFDRLCQRSCLKEHPLLSAHLSVHPGRFDMREMVCTKGVEQRHQPATFIPKDSATPVVQSSHTIHTQPLGTCVVCAPLCVYGTHTAPGDPGPGSSAVWDPETGAWLSDSPDWRELACSRFDH